MSYLDTPQICQNEKDGDILAAKKEMKLADEEDFGNRFVSLEDHYLRINVFLLLCKEHVGTVCKANGFKVSKVGCQEVKRCDGDHNSHSVHGVNEGPGFGTLWSTLGQVTLPGARHP